MPPAPTRQHHLSCEGRGRLTSRCEPSAQRSVHTHTATVELR